MKPEQQMKILKVVMVMGICLFLFGHYLISYTDFTEVHGVKGFMISAGCIAVGIIMSLPTKIYLTFLLMTKENKSRAENTNIKNKIPEK